MYKNISTMRELVYRSSISYENDVAFEFERKKQIIQITFKQFRNDIICLENYFRKLGIKPGDKVAVWSENSYEWIITYFAVIGISAVIIPVDSELLYQDVLGLLTKYSIDSLVYSPKFEEYALKMHGDGKLKCFISTEDVAQCIKEQGNVFEQKISEEIVRDGDYNKLCQISFTSGTTGEMKGVMFSEKNIISDAIGSADIIDPGLHGTVVLILPLNHMFSIVASLLVPIMCGVKTIICRDKKYFLQDIIRTKPKWLVVVPSIIDSLYKILSNSHAEELKQQILNSGIQYIVVGGAILRSEYEEVFDKYGIRIVNGYGITECSPVVTVNRHDYVRKGSCGIAITGCEFKINQPDENGIGEIYVKGKNVMQGYYCNESENEKAFDNGCFRTGDLGYKDEDGYLFITGRIKNLIILDNGQNVSSEELEGLLYSKIPFVQESIVYEYNNKITAEIFAGNREEEKEESIKDSIKKLNKELPSYKRIENVIFRDMEFPKTNTLKIRRKKV